MIVKGSYRKRGKERDTGNSELKISLQYLKLHRVILVSGYKRCKPAMSSHPKEEAILSQKV